MPACQPPEVPIADADVIVVQIKQHIHHASPNLIYEGKGIQRIENYRVLSQRSSTEEESEEIIFASLVNPFLMTS